MRFTPAHLLLEATAALGLLRKHREVLAEDRDELEGPDLTRGSRGSGFTLGRQHRLAPADRRVHLRS